MKLLPVCVDPLVQHQVRMLNNPVESMSVDDVKLQLWNEKHHTGSIFEVLRLVGGPVHVIPGTMVAQYEKASHINTLRSLLFCAPCVRMHLCFC
jgi:hypothetical protein